MTDRSTRRPLEILSPVLPRGEHNAARLAERGGMTMLAGSVGVTMNHEARAAGLECRNDRTRVHIHDVRGRRAGVSFATGARGAREPLARLKRQREDPAVE